MTPEQLTTFRAMPRWQRRIGFWSALPITPFIFAWAYVSTLGREIYRAFGYARREFRGGVSELRETWREANRL
jgi:hypothetical protein